MSSEKPEISREYAVKAPSRALLRECRRGTVAQVPGPPALGVITADGRPAGARKRTASAADRGTERAICLQADPQPSLVCLPADIWVDGDRQPIGRKEAVVSFLAVKASESPGELAVRVVLVGSLPGD